ncbi:MAG: diaminopimelate decarboxylase [Gammaproteobacteria bacterium]|nr:diaminopimelate decarboxylase [Gammaproteobacteria bacterium]
MSHFHFQNNELFVEQVSARQLAADYGTPCYVYSRAALETNYNNFQSAFHNQQHMICYSVKANSNIAVLNLLARLGSGFDIVSGGELERVLRAGGDPGKIVFSGVGKLPDEIQRALEVGIRCFNVESEAELLLIHNIAAAKNMLAPVSLRVNPDVDPQTHAYIATGLRENKFGISGERILETYRVAEDLAHIEIVGVDCHIGSQLTDLGPFQEALKTCLEIVDTLAADGISIQHIDMGGGLGVRYREETPPTIEEYAAAIKQMIGHRNMELIFEPGRYIAANAGILLTRISYLKDNDLKHFAIVDAAMNDLLRPSLYNAWQNVIATVQSNQTPGVYDIVGPVCETSDFLAKERSLAIQSGDLLAIESCGAYGFVMSSNYNSRNRAPEIIVDGHDVYVVRQRETIDMQLALESLLPE